MFESESQRGLIGWTLLSLVNRGSYWSESGPSPAALSLWEQKGGPMSHGEKVMFGIAWAIWTGNNEWPLTFDEVLYTLDPTGQEALGALLVALATGKDAVERWLTQWKPQPKRV